MVNASEDNTGLTEHENLDVVPTALEEIKTAAIFIFHVK